MAYSSFTALDLKNKFGINQRFVEHLFDDFEPRKSSQLLQQTLKHNVGFALGQGTEKARSEFIIAPVLTELHIQTKEQISIFSGVEFNVDKKRGLSGWCDFLISRSPFQRELEAPVIVAVEAKQQNFEQGLTQCIAEMYAAQIFNEKQGNAIQKIYGCVTTGDIWRFLILENNEAKIETQSYDIGQDIERILGILFTMATEITQ